MRVHLPYKTTDAAGGIYDQNCVWQLVVNVECGLTSRHLPKDPADCAIRFRASAATFACRNLAERSSRFAISELRFNSQHRPYDHKEWEMPQSETARNNLHPMDSTEWWRVPATDCWRRFQRCDHLGGPQTANRPCLISARGGFSDILGIGHHQTC